MEVVSRSIDELQFLIDIFQSSKEFMNNNDRQTFFRFIFKELEDLNINLLIYKNE